MLSRRTIILGAVCMAVAKPAFAADPAAKPSSRRSTMPTRARMPKACRSTPSASSGATSSPRWRLLMVKDQKDAARRNEAPNLDGDPFLDAQDWDVDAFDIAVTDRRQQCASATVKFRNRRYDDRRPTRPGQDRRLARRRHHLAARRQERDLARALPPLTRCNRVEIGAGEGNRTLVISLEGFCSTIELHPRVKRTLDATRPLL